ncbi:MAG: hypothetical protein EOO71_03505 [Myxococcaceae bacterium]|nr:MAG: hypothetical protein EOO71_03505 [Myxococcaceae bacterium]
MADDKDKKDEEGAKPFRGLNFLGRCVDITVVSPLQPGMLFRNGGGVLTEGVVAFKAKDCTEDTSNPAIKLPPKVHYNPLSNGIQDEGETIATSAEELMSRFAASVQVEGEFSAVSFKASLDYQNSAKATSGSSSFISFSQAFFEDEEVELDEDFVTSDALNAKLQKSLEALPKDRASDADRTKYANFIKKYGTHFIWSAVFGGRVYRQTTKSASEYSKARSEAIAAEASVNVSSLVYSAGVSASASKDTSSASSGSKTFFKENATWYGGENRSDFVEWVETIAKDPQPLKLRLRRLSTLFQQKPFSDIADIQVKGKHLDASVTDFIDEHCKTQRSLSGRKFHLAAGQGSDTRYLTISDSYRDNKATLSNAEGKVAWRMILTGLKDEYRLDSLSPQGTLTYSSGGTSFYGGEPFLLGVSDSDVTLVSGEGADAQVSWRLVPADGAEDAYYLQLRATTGTVHSLHDRWLVVSSGKLQLVSSGELHRRTAWRLEPLTETAR